MPGPKPALIDPRHETSDVAIRFGTGLYPGYRVEKMLTPDYVLVCSPGLASGEPPLREWLKLAGVSGMDAERGPRFSNSILVIEAALEGQGVALVLKQQVEADVAAGRLLIPFAISMPSAYAYFLVIPEAVAGPVVVLAFEQWLRSEIGPQCGL